MDSLIVDDLSFTIPVESFKRQSGCALDYGGSLIKVAFASPCGDPSRPPSRLRVNCVTYRAENLRAALMDLRARVGQALVPGEALRTCGMGCNKHRDAFIETLGVDLLNVQEFECFVDAFRYLSATLPEGELLVPESDKVKAIREEHLKDAEPFIRSFAGHSQRGIGWKFSHEEEQRVASLSSSSDDDDDAARAARRHRRRERRHRRRAERQQTQEERRHDTQQNRCGININYPILLYVCGSGGCPVLVNADGSHCPMDAHPTAGRFLLGLGRLLTGAKSFEELVSLAESGDQGQVNTWTADVKGEAADSYASTPKYMMMTGLGKAAAADPASFCRSDLAAATLTVVAESLAESVQLWALLLDIRHVYIAGSLVSSSAVREELAKFIMLRSTVNSLGRSTGFSFIQQGSYLGAIGCLLATLRTELSTVLQLADANSED